MTNLEGVRGILRGKVWLVGAGPGNPELLTVRADRLIRAADVLAYDELVSPEILSLAPRGAERIAVGRRAKGCRHHEERIHPLVIQRALEGRNVVRLKGGDPFVFGRGGEEAQELAAARVPFEVVPGISAALGAAASTHIPLTHRDVSSSVTLATAHFKDDGDKETLAAILPREGTLVLYMGLGRLEQTLLALIDQGRPPTTPAAVVSHATLPDERTITATLATLAAIVRSANVTAPALLIVGEVVAHAVKSTAAHVCEAREETA